MCQTFKAEHPKELPENNLRDAGKRVGLKLRKHELHYSNLKNKHTRTST